ncbi:hypothetical protein BZA70DRAFT_176987 [Myxozyma melibiosi]|uniref:Protein EFR3 n=1 Tax=Myxozyma melibiosi TaxID=54550 RepID=A0ABR1F5Y8_9ASCO
MRNKFRPKHQRLILQCFPGGRASEKHPNSSELSYLLYYVSTRRSKLLKVGRFLERKAKSDVWHARTGNVQVILDISRALIDRCPTDLNLFADFIISILTTVLNTNDLAMCQYSEATFRSFCKHHDGGLLADDQVFLQKFINLLKLYMSIGHRSSAAHDDSWTLISLRAAKSISSSEALYSSNGQLQEQIKIIAPSILDQLYSDTNDNLFAINARLQALTAASTGKGDSEHSLNNASASQRRSVDVETAGNGDVDDDEASLLALQSLRKLFESSDSGPPQVRYSSLAVVRYILAHSKNESWATSMVDLMAQWTPVQSRFVILRSLLEILTVLPNDEMKQKLVITKLISSLLSSSVNLAGLSVLDVLHIIFSQILSLIELEPNGILKSPDRERRELVERLAVAAGDLASHIYYSNQIADMVTEVLVNMRPPHSGNDHGKHGNGGNKSSSDYSNLEKEESDDERGKSSHNGGKKSIGIVDSTVEPLAGPPSTVNSFTNLEKYLARARNYGSADKDAIIIGLQIVKEVIQIANSVETGVKRNVVPLQAWDHTEWALTDASSAVQHAYAAALLEYLQTEVANDMSGTFALGKHVSSKSGFLAKLHLALYDYALRESNTEEDYCIINSILLGVADAPECFGIVYGLPMVLHLQETVHSQKLGFSGAVGDQLKLKSENLMYLDSIVLTYLSAVASKLDSETLKREVEGDIARRKSSQSWKTAITNPARKLSTKGDIFAEKEKKSPAMQLGGDSDGDSDEGSDVANEKNKSNEESNGISNGSGSSVDRTTVAQALESVGLPEDVKAEFVGPWSRELIMKESEFALFFPMLRYFG